jgi:hypothetical protein
MPSLYRCRMTLPAALSLALLGPIASADSGVQTYTFNPVADTSLYADITGNDLSWDDVSDGRGGSLWLSTTAGGVLRRSLLRFDLSAIPAGLQVVSVSLSLFESRSRGDHDVALHRVLASWGEGQSNGGSAGVGATATAGDATWRWRDYGVTEWSQRGGDFFSTASATTLVGQQNATYTWQSTNQLVADVQGWLSDPSTSHGWILIGPEVDAQNAKRFDSREGLLASQRPLLTVQVAAIPEATPLAMLTAGLLLLTLRQRSRQRR